MPLPTKTFTGILSRTNNFVRMNILKCLLTIFISLLLLVACQNYYMAVKQPKNAAIIDSLNKQNRYFVLRSGSQAFYMKNITLSADRKTLEATLDTLPYEHRLHLINGRNGKMRYRKTDPQDLPVLSEVHLYIVPDNTAAAGSRYSLSLDQVQKMEVIEKDKKRTTNSYVLGAVGFTLGVMVLTAIIVAATKSSCPFVSAYDGEQFSLQGEIYGGAIYPQLERHDFLPLKMAPLPDSSLQLKISNELLERQYTDIAELWVVTHPKNKKVMVDEKGNLYSITQQEAPLSARLNNNKDVTTSLVQAADNALLYMDDSTSTDARNEVVMKFKKPGNIKTGKLILILKNSYWLDLLYGELARGFGSYYPTYIRKQQGKPASELLKWVNEQQIPLEVSIKTKAGWKKITTLKTIGPLATRQIVVPIDISETTGDLADVKLSSGFMFWEIDYAAIDYSNEEAFMVQKLVPVSAKDETGKDVLSLLQTEDGQYLEQPHIGNVTTITYKGATTPGIDQTQTFFLKTKGYYEHIRNFKNKPDIGFLQQFKKPGAFPKYGMALYLIISAENVKALARSN